VFGFVKQGADVFVCLAYISLPKEAGWKALVKSFATELINRYGLEVVSTFYFEVYNEYNCGFLSAPDPQKAYYDLYEWTSTTLKVCVLLLLLLRVLNVLSF
jgi:hypothetical protein